MSKNVTYVLTCEEFNGSDCVTEVWTVDPSLQQFLTFDFKDFAAGFSSVMGLFITGFVIGFILSIIKKAR